ncbi:MAG: manganese efflux pump [Oscillospiraceae bacterium]|nr:manganese efflux pump [Oscillospiraceae bacterium]
MYFSLSTVLEAMMLALVLSLDAFVASFAYGSKSIKIPMRSAWVITLTCAGVVGLALLVGSLLRQYISYGLAAWISFTILFILGIVKLLDSITKSIIRRRAVRGELKFSLFNLNFILMLYADPEQADVDGSKILSPAEATSLALALSLDGLGVGLGAAIGSANGLVVFLGAIVTGIAAVVFGGRLGNKAAEKAKLNISWLSGVLLIALAFASL